MIIRVEHKLTVVCEYDSAHFFCLKTDTAEQFFEEVNKELLKNKQIVLEDLDFTDKVTELESKLLHDN